MDRQNVWTLYEHLVPLRNTERERRFKMDCWISTAHLDDADEEVSRADLVPDPYKCGAAACLLGWAALIAHKQDPSKYPTMNVEKEGSDWLGLTHPEANRWAMGYWHPARRSSRYYELGWISLNDALMFLRKVLENPDEAAGLAQLEDADLPTWEQDLADRMAAAQYAKAHEPTPRILT